MRKVTIQILALTMILILTGSFALAQKETRISFKRGKNSAILTGTLPAGGARSFVVRGKPEQELSVDTKNKSIAVNLRRGNAETTEDFGSLLAALKENGDYVFELSNQSNRAIRFRMQVIIYDVKDVTP